MNIKEKLEKLRCIMKEKRIDIYLIPSSDNHQSEYVGDHFKSRAFISGFTGSAGTVVVTQTEAGLWTDGRYFIQAEAQLEGSSIKLFKMGNPGVPTVEEYIVATLPENGVLGFDGRVISQSQGKTFAQKISVKNGRIESQFDLINNIWKDRPDMSKEPIFLLEEKYSGESTASKLARLREDMAKEGATSHIMITLDDIAWLLNFRGHDVAYTMVALSYLVVDLNAVHLFMDESKVSAEIRAVFEKDNIILHPYNDIYEYVKAMDSNEVILIDPARLNYALFSAIPAGVKTVEKMNPCIPFKAAKNETELENIRVAHIKDGVAHTKFMYWLKNEFKKGHVRKEPITELSASDKLEAFRAEQDDFIAPSFGPICAYGAHAAMCHYSSTPETNCELQEGNFFLSDTGGSYMQGSIDITRTVALGDICDLFKVHFTTVLRANLALADAKFKYGCVGQNLDILARQPFWDQNLDFNHGTGHGVGYLLSIHEGPQNFAWQHRPQAARFEEGMVITNEPGLYIEGSHGIRLENEMIVRKGVKNEYGQFMYFEPITFVPFDLDAVDVSLLSTKEKSLLNTYHKQVYDKISPFLTEDEKAWLKIYTREI